MVVGMVITESCNLKISFCSLSYSAIVVFEGKIIIQ